MENKMTRGITEKFRVGRNKMEVEVTVWSDDTVEFAISPSLGERLVHFRIDPASALTAFLKSVESEDWDWEKR